MRDAILHELADDPTLEPRDVIVMCPDIETFAPLIQATFGAGEISEDEDDELDALAAGDRPPDLRVRLADRSLRQTNPVLGVVARLLELVGQRVTASQVLELAEREPVRRRFRLDDDDVSRLHEWVRTSGIRWGLDAEHRAPFKLAELANGTWRFGLDRLLVGVTMTDTDQGLFEGVLPLDDVESGAIELAGKLAELVDRLRRGDRRAGRDADRPGMDSRPGQRRGRAHRRARPGRLAALGAAAAAGRHRARGGELRRRAGAGRGPRAAGRAAAGPPDARELPDRAPDDLHADADALGAAPGRLPARARRRHVPAQGRRATATTCCSTSRTWASATPAARTASCCWTR